MEIKVENLTRRFGGTLALDDVSFTLASGKVTGLVGPNGAGKTTLLRIMSAQDAPDSGDILYDGISLVDYPERVAYRAALMPDTLPDTSAWRVWDYLDFYARANRLEGAVRIRRLEEIRELCNLMPIWEKRLNTISKGMKQRVSLARVLLASPELLLLDEPAAGLDPRARIELRDIIRKLSGQGSTILLSSHILSELEDMCDEMMIMECGRKVSHGSLAQLENDRRKAASRCEFVLEFQEVTIEMLEQLRHLPGCLECRQEDRRRVRITTASQELADGFMAALFQAHIPVAAYHAGGLSLESLFIESTGNKLQ